MTTATLDSATEVLAYARQQRAAALAAEANVLQAAVVWADQHPVESIVEAACVPGTQRQLAVAGPGSPLVAEFCVAELGAALGISTDAARELVGDAVELAHRLPRVFARVVAGDLPAWRARRVAQATKGLPREGARFVDRQVAPFAHRVGVAQLDRLVATATARFAPHQAAADARAAAERRHFDVHHDQLSFDGTCQVSAELDLRDALDLEDAIARTAESLRAGGSDLPLDVRRSMAAGLLARGQEGLDLEPANAPARELVLHVHLDGDGLASVEEHHRLVTLDQVRGWCEQAGSRVTLRPVIDLAAELTSTGYHPSDTLAEQVRLRDRTCVFPWCSRPARSCDLDHVVEHDRGGPTSSANLAPLCRGHHRLKTHSPWTYTVVEPGTYVWTSPHGAAYLRDRSGSSSLDP